MTCLISKLDKHVGEKYLLVNGSKKNIIAKIEVQQPPKEFKVIKNYIYKVSR
jgi:hypothetical protein